MSESNDAARRKIDDEDRPRHERANIELPYDADDLSIGRRSARHSRSFLTYAGYARAWRTLTTRDDTPHYRWADAGGPRFKPDDLAEVFAREIEPRATVPRSPDGVYRSLSRMWGTEQLMDATFRGATGEWSGDLLRSAAPWVTVQAYYSCFSATQALIWIERGDEIDQHAAVRRAFADLWSPDTCNLMPFSASAAARPATTPRAVEFRGIPDGTNPARTDPAGYWTRFEAWDVAALSLRAALDRHLDDRYAQRRDSLRRSGATSPSQVRLPKSDREAIRAKTRPFTILDVLHRFRVAANYRDADVFILGPTDDDAIRAFIVNMLHTTSALLLATELRIAASTKPGAMQGVARAWLSMFGGRQSPLEDRVDYLNELSGR